MSINEGVECWVVGGIAAVYAHDPKNSSWTRLMVRLIAWLPRSNEAAGRGLQRGATKAGARAGVPAGA